MAGIKKRHYCVIGAGASGLVAIKSCLEVYADVTCFEASDDIGGLWRYTDEVTEKACVYKSAVLNSSKEYTTYSDFPFPDDFPNYMRHEKIFEYFKQYAEYFNLNKHIKFNTAVIKVDCASDYDATGRWNVTYQDSVTGKEMTTTFDGVFVCTGHHAQPYYPTFPGLDKFKGKVIHSHDYRKPAGFEDKHILVVGIGNSAGDISVELCRNAKSLHLSTRRGAWCLARRLPDGMPVDSGVSRFKWWLASSLPYWLADIMLECLFAKLDHNLLGIRPSFGPTATTPLVNDDFPNRILSGLIKIQPDVKEFGSNSVTFADGTKVENLDVVVLATGYVFGFPFLSPSILSVEGCRVDLYKMVFPLNLKHPTLAIIGCIEGDNALLPVSELQSRWAVRVFSGVNKLPSQEEQATQIEKHQKYLTERYVASQRMGNLVDAVTYPDDIGQEIGCTPSIIETVCKCDLSLAWALLFGRYLPYHYRLVGPNSWPGARDATLTVDQRVRKPLKTNIADYVKGKMKRE